MKSKLTKRQKDIMSLFLLGFTNEAIAKELNLSIHTVKSHVRNIYEIYGLSGLKNRDLRVLAALRYLRNLNNVGSKNEQL